MSDDPPPPDLPAKGVRGALRRLRHPWLFGLAALAFVVDLFVPDMVPFVDEIVLAAVTAGLAMWRERRPTDVEDD